MKSELQEGFEKVQQRSEVHSLWILFGFSFFFLGVYFSSNKGFSGQISFHAIPVFFSVYMPLLIIRMVLAQRGLLNEFWRTFGSLIDVGLIVGLIWSWHIQYNQPVSFSLKAPTSAALYLMLALRVLNFSVRQILLTGISSALGWTLILVHAVYDSKVPCTHNYVKYLTSNHCLVGAEVEKILLLLTVTFVLAVSVRNSKRLLVEMLAGSRLNRELSRFFSPDVAKVIKNGSSTLMPGQACFREAAILMIDLRGFTTLSTWLKAEEILDIIREYQTRVTQIVFRYRGCVDKFMGDGILIHFGAVLPSITAPLDCLESVMEIASELKRWNDERRKKNESPLRFGMACALGEVLFGIVGDRDRLEFTTIGETVNFTAKLEKHTKALGASIVTTQKLVERACAQGFKVPYGSFSFPNASVPGINRPMDLLVLEEHFTEAKTTQDTAVLHKLAA